MVIEVIQKNRKRRAVFLDRDGVINISDVVDGKPYAPRNLDDFILYEGAAEAVVRLKQEGFLVIVVTNQPDVGNGMVGKETVEEMHIQLKKLMPLDKICVCYHSQLDDCDCRKPRPGMILKCAEEFGIDLQASFIVGDRRTDIEAGKAAGCQTVFIDRHYHEPVPQYTDVICDSLIDAVTFILNQNMMINY